MPQTLPTLPDFLDPHSQDLDERHALKTFLGKTPEQARALFRENFLFYQEELSYMRPPALRFYLLPAIDYLLSQDANDDSDAASTFCSLLESRLKNDPAALAPIAPLLITTLHQLLASFNRFNCSPDIYGNLPARYQLLIPHLTSLPSHP